MNYESYWIPVNFTDAGRAFGLFETRNLIEALLLTLPVLYLCVRLLPFALTTKLVVTLTIIVPVGGFALIGISDDSLTRWLAGWLRWRRQRRVMYYRGEANRK
ncbi:MAG: hypothetical protein IJQ98_06665 [Oscillospiraceae bacterium]|nr:hypothetical protein [Oscillospiraceae bacterium]